MKTIHLLLLSTAPVLAAMNAQVTGISPTQAILTYTAPSASACVLEVSEQPTFRPLVRDVDPSIFPNADRDTRSGNLISGQQRTFVIGKRAAERALNGRMVSRALQAYTRHYYRLTCGSAIATGQFDTKNLAVGNTAPEPYPVDPDRPGQYAWPNMNFAGGTNERIIDPQTGIAIRRLTGPQSFLYQGFPNQPARGAFDDSGSANAWRFSEPGALPGTYAANGSSPPKMYVPMDPTALARYFPPAQRDENVQLNWVTIVLTGASSARGEDGKLLVCLTVNGSSCASDTAVPETDLSGCGSGCTIGDTQPELAGWTGGAVPSFSGTDIGLHTTVAQYDPATGVLTRTQGDYFEPAPGSRVWIDGTPHKVRAAAGVNSITIETGLALTNPTVIGSSFGILVWKKTTAAGSSVSLSQVKFNIGASFAFSFWQQASAEQCQPTPVQYQGQNGYHCVLPAGGSSVLAWIDRTYGNANLLGHMSVLKKVDSGGNGWSTSTLTSSSAMFDATDPNILYAVIPDQNKRQIVLRMTYSGDNSPRSGGVNYNDAPWSDVQNLTPAQPSNYDLESLIQRFDSRYDPARYTCSASRVHAGKVIIFCSASQDVAPGGWVVVFDPAIKVGPNSNPVIAAVPTNGARNPYPTRLRWCVFHSLATGDPGWLLIGANPASSGETFSTRLSAAIGTGDAKISVTGEPGNGAIDIARPGDLFQIDSELVKITAKAGTGSWTVDRAQAGSKAGAHASGAAAVARCALTEISTDIWWNSAADPHGANASGKTVTADDPYFSGGHGAMSLGAFTRVVNGAKCGSSAGGPTCYITRDGPLETNIHQPPTSYTNMAPAFAGIASAPYAFESHPSRNQSAASEYEQQWVLDSHPILDGNFLKAPVSLVSGAKQLYVLKQKLNSKQVPAYASCGSHPLLDVSGAASLIGDGPADAYKYCVPNAAGECRKGSARGEVYVNCPNLTVLSCGGQYESNGSNPEDVCVYDGNLIAGAQVVQASTAVTDRTGAYTRRITHGFARYRRQEEVYFANGKALPGGEWALFLGRWVDGQRSDIYAAKLPPFPQPDGVTRNTFVPVSVKIAPAPAGAADTVVEFGYDPGFYCGSRRETCIAASSAFTETNPYYWAGESYTGMRCSSGCTVAIPAISQRVLYYRARHRDSTGRVLSVGSTAVVAVP